MQSENEFSTLLGWACLNQYSAADRFPILAAASIIFPEAFACGNALAALRHGGALAMIGWLHTTDQLLQKRLQTVIFAFRDAKIKSCEI